MFIKPKPSKSLLIVCDIQEIFKPRIFKMNVVLNSTKFLIGACAQMNIPLFVSQHNSKVFGNTATELTDKIKSSYEENFFQIEKRQFSLCTSDFDAFISKNQQIENIILTGIETHICILNSALDLKRKGLNVYLVADATSSQRAYDRKIAIDRMQHLGVTLTTAESIVYELAETSEGDLFKKILAEVKARNTEEMFE